MDELNSQPTFWQRIASWFRQDQTVQTTTESERVSDPVRKAEVKNFDIPSNDPILALIQHSAGVIEVDKIDLESPTLDALREEGVQLALPLVSQGELIGLLNLGPRLSEQEYSRDDYRLLNNLATQASPALRVAQLVRQQEAEARQRERIEQELRVARVIQETLLPKEVPSYAGWQIQAHWQPAREVGGDFYDFIQLSDGRMGVIIADVTDKGVPAAMVMATTRSILRSVAENTLSPGKVLARANELLHPDIPPKMFVTCLYLVIEPESGKVTFANAGHNLPYLIQGSSVTELRATGMPLGLMPDMEYEEVEAELSPGGCLLLSSDGLVEAHNPQREMYGFERMEAVMASEGDAKKIVSRLLSSLGEFVGENNEQEDDITLVTLQHILDGNSAEVEVDWSVVTEFEISSRQGNERPVSKKVVDELAEYNLGEKLEKRLETAVAEATMNAMEHGNQYKEELPVRIQVMSSSTKIAVRIYDFGQGLPQTEIVTPDLDSKLAGEQSPRGWGLFLIRNMIDEMNIWKWEQGQVIELIVNRKSA